ncbi:MAG: alpha/beta fold hydrolase, partial [Acidimicrobiia bacterium]|nr:alpha/beta fold hydrolase [Acidimicrobiia bacterium]
VERRDRFDRLVIMNTGLFSTHASPSPAFMQWRAFVQRTPDLPVTMVMGNAARQTWDESVYRAYEAPFASADDKVGAHRFPLIVPLSADDPGAAEMLEVRRALEAWTDPALVLFATEDPIFAPAVGQRLVDAIPGAEPLELVPDAGHFLQEDQGEAVAEHIVAFLRRSE